MVCHRIDDYVNEERNVSFTAYMYSVLMGIGPAFSHPANSKKVYPPHFCDSLHV